MTDCIVDVQIASRIPENELPQTIQFQAWASKTIASLLPLRRASEVTIRIVDEGESHQLNLRYRHQDKATNVLSFPIEVPIEIDLPLLGDLVICAPVVMTEAANQNKLPESHWAHMVIHGMLHLLGFDHVDDVDAHEMESLEVRIMHELGYQNPYIG